MKATTNTGVCIDIGMWRRFLRERGISRQRVCAYYLGGHVPPSADDVASCQRLLNELFNDAVTLGAVTTPADTTADDVTLEVMGPPEPGHLNSIVRVNANVRGGHVRRFYGSINITPYINAYATLAGCTPLLERVNELTSRL